MNHGKTPENPWKKCRTTGGFPGFFAFLLGQNLKKWKLIHDCHLFFLKHAETLEDSKKIGGEPVEIGD